MENIKSISDRKKGIGPRARGVAWREMGEYCPKWRRYHVSMPACEDCPLRSDSGARDCRGNLIGWRDWLYKRAFNKEKERLWLEGEGLWGVRDDD